MYKSLFKLPMGSLEFNPTRWIHVKVCSYKQVSLLGLKCNICQRKMVPFAVRTVFNSNGLKIRFKASGELVKIELKRLFSSKTLQLLNGFWFNGKSCLSFKCDVTLEKYCQSAFWASLMKFLDGYQNQIMKVTTSKSLLTSELLRTCFYANFSCYDAKGSVSS